METSLVPSLTPLLWLLGAALALVIASRSFTIAKGNQIILLERRWFGRQMPDGRTVALRDEVGVQARVLGPGFHLLFPFIYRVMKRDFCVIKKDMVGVVRAIAGAPIPSGSFMARSVACDLFQDGEAFLRNGGEKGPQLAILPEGEYKINPHLFEVTEVPATMIEDDEVGYVEAIDGKRVAREGGNFGSPVECDSFQDADGFIQNGGQKGPQIQFLPPGYYRVNTLMFRVQKLPITRIPGGKVGLVEATDGARIPEGRLLAARITGHSNFFDGEAFIRNGGEKGRQLDVLMPGVYRLNPMLFRIIEIADWTHVGADQVGIVTINEGKPITDPSKIAADELPLNVHDNFQNADAFLKAGGQKGLQIPVLRAGNYAINPWFATIEKVDMIQVQIGSCGVVTSYVGGEGQDLTDDAVNAKIVANGSKGIWAEPLQPGKHPLNTKICKVDIVPTTQILLNWADTRSSAHELDSSLKTITLRTADAFNVNMDVSVIIHIPVKNAPKVIANLGSVKNMISQVLEPAISSHFRNAAQYIKALDLYTQRRELQEKAKEHIDTVLRVHHIDSKDTLIADVVLPVELTKTVTDRQIAEQEKKTFATQKEAQDERRALENAKAQANMQPQVVESERNVEIQKNLAEGRIKEAEGSKQAAILTAEGKATAVRLEAGGKAEATKVNADADAQAIQKVGTAEAEIILAKGTSTAEAYKLEVAAMGREVFGQIRVIDKIASSQLKFIPDNLVVGGGAGGGDGNGLVNGLFGIALLEKLSGRSFVAAPAAPEPPK
ncbi:MAG TPA: SPFH domain-containing protein [Anaeromyxobacteraceae bacterium]|nr:SPFH domain-containing protein [Anaeromyxobacteraceae bacterium]